MLWRTPLILAIGRQRQDLWKLEARQSYSRSRFKKKKKEGEYASGAEKDAEGSMNRRKGEAHRLAEGGAWQRLDGVEWRGKSFIRVWHVRVGVL